MKEKSAFDAIIEQFAGKPPVGTIVILRFMMDNNYSPEEWWEAEIRLLAEGLIIVDNESNKQTSMITIKRPR